jgi:RNA polymerase sigma-70 factor (ECF subfamily)
MDAKKLFCQKTQAFKTSKSMPFSELSDEKLLREASQGRFSAFEEFLERHQERLYNFLWRLCGSEEAAGELFERSFSEFFRMRGSQAASQGATTLLFGVALRLALRKLAEEPGLGVGRGAPPQGDRSSLEWRSARLNEALLSLPVKERAALLLSFFDSFSFAAAAACLNEREENARSLAGRGLGRLAETLGDGFLSGGLP